VVARSGVGGGNVRELENTVTRLVALSEGGRRLTKEVLTPDPGRSATPTSGSFRERVEKLERALLTQALAATGGNQSEAARTLSLSRATFLDKLKRYGFN
jgi:DNA-binding NtrC family response regulator